MGNLVWAIDSVDPEGVLCWLFVAEWGFLNKVLVLFIPFDYVRWFHAVELLKVRRGTIIGVGVFECKTAPPGSLAVYLFLYHELRRPEQWHSSFLCTWSPQKEVGLQL